MKVKLSTLLLLSVILSFPGCDSDEATVIDGKFTFSFTANDSNTGGRKGSEDAPAFASYTLKKSDGSIHSNKVELYQFNDGYVTQPQQLGTGHYKLEQFLILDSENNTIYAAPLAGSALADLVEHPLPLSFNISPEETTSVSPEVVATEGHLPADLGYADFSFNVTIKNIKFVLPLHPDLVSKYRSAKLKITQGSYSKTVSFSGSASTTLYANVLVKSNAAVDASVLVETDNIYTSAYPPHSGWEDHVQLRSSTSQFEFHQQLPAAQGIFTVPQFTHKIGRGWDFTSAILKAAGGNGSYIQVKYQKEGLCSDKIKIESNVSDFPAPANGALHMADKIVWSQHDASYHQSFILKGVNGFYNSPATCQGEFCDLYPEWLSESYAQFVPVCEDGDWKFFDSYIRIQTRRDGVLNYLNLYFWLAQDGGDSSSGGRKKPLHNGDMFTLNR